MNLIASDIVISSFDENRWVINTPDSRNILANKAVVDLIRILQNSDSLPTALEQFNREFNYQYDQSTFLKIINEKLLKYGLLSGTNVKFEKFKYLKFRVQFLPASFVKILSYPFRFFFTPRIFWISLFLLAGFSLVILYQQFYSNPMVLNNNHYTFFVIPFALFISSFLHELGHTAACSKNNISHGGVGFGFYFIFPVFYADISNIWLVSRHKRIIANLAGIFNEILLTSIFSMIYLISKDLVYLLISSMIFLKILMELNPFFRMDGYWILSDLTNTPNLLPKSNRLVKEYFVKLFKTKKFDSVAKKDIMLFIYGITNSFITTFYLIYVLMIYRRDLFLFPKRFFDLFNDVITLNFDLTVFNKSFFLILFFYLIFIRIFIKKINTLAIGRFKKVGLSIENKTP